MVDLAEYLELRKRPSGPAAMCQSWRDLTFLHFSADPEEIQKTLPPGVSVDTFNGRAWIGLVPFWMTGIRHPKLPAIPGLSSFPETNVRTYVHHGGKQPGVWFYSLDAALLPACLFARATFGLPYFHARMAVTRNSKIQYQSRRREASLDAEIELGTSMELPKPGSLEFFLIERYLLYSVKSGRLQTGIVNHPPYQLRNARVLRCEESLISSNQLSPKPWEHICFSPGVDVEVFKLQKA
jgi:uncharacterized protein YqjF (DUF2071 family)